MLAADNFYTLIAEFQIKNRRNALHKEISSVAQTSVCVLFQWVLNKFVQRCMYLAECLTSGLPAPTASCLLPQIIYPVYRGSRKHRNYRRRRSGLCHSSRRVKTLERCLPGRADAEIRNGRKHAQ